MNAVDFAPKKHLTTSDQRRLAALAQKDNQTPEDYIETLIKRELFAQPAAKPQPKARR